MSRGSSRLPEFENYSIERQIGRGGMGVVYLGRHKGLQRQVAVKVILEQHTQDDKVRERFLREARMMATLDHPNIVRVHDLIERDEDVAFVMEHIEGRSLERMIGREVGPIPHEKALPLFNQLLDAVGYAHRQGIIHRDLKPANILVTNDNRVKVTDFGIAKAAGASKLTRTGTVLGTPIYMAPEQILGKQVDHRADIYALGMTLYVMLAGRAPFDEDETSEFVLLKSCMEDEIPDPRTYYPYIPDELVHAVRKAIDRSLNSRYSSCDDIFHAIQVTDLVKINDDNYAESNENSHEKSQDQITPHDDRKKLKFVTSTFGNFVYHSKSDFSRDLEDIIENEPSTEYWVKAIIAITIISIIVLSIFASTN